MSQSDTPRWMWAIAAGLLVVVTLYALYSRQTVRHVKFPGGEIQFGDAASPADPGVGFSISYDPGTRVTQEGTASVYIEGSEIARLSIGEGRPFHTVTARVARPGTYAYRVDQSEVQMLHPIGADDPERLVPVRMSMSGEGKIDIQPGVAFKVTPFLRGGEWGTQLRPVQSEQEREEERERSRKELEEIFAASPEPQK